MPLLKRKAFEKSKVSDYLRDDDEVFHCELTDEIFKDYEEYCERIILVNSMVWSCEMTGKNNLTYSEALDSEKAARKTLKDLPMDLRLMILFLAAKTNRTAFTDMAEDVGDYMKERFFVGETIEVCIGGESWKEAHILSVELLNGQESSNIPPAALYKYEVELLNESSEAGEISTVSHDKIRRAKGTFSKEKCRLFLKQFVEMNQGGIICIKKQALEKYNIQKVMFNQVFTGSPPVFPSSKKLAKPSISPGNKKPIANKLNKSLNKSLPKASPDQKGKQQSMDKFVKKTDKATEATKPKAPNPQAKKNAQDLAEKMRRAEELMRQRKEDEKARKKEKHAKLQAYIKEWHKVKDDLELEDHKPLPPGTPINIDGIPHTQFGDFLAVLEFVHLYSDILKTKDIFPHGLDPDTFRKALTMKEHAGMFCDLVQMLLTTIFTLQEDEAEEYNEGGGIAESTEEQKLEDGEVGLTQAVELATKAGKWSQTYLGTPLSKLHLDATTVSEVLRLHLLSSGGLAGAGCVSWRYQQRGGYSSRDDPALRLTTQRPHILHTLTKKHIAQIHTKDKFQVVHCLMNQILSYATVRDVIEERLESYRLMKHELRVSAAQERKREAEFLSTRAKMKREANMKKEEQKLTGEAAKEVDEELSVQLDKLVKEGETKKNQYQKKVKQLHADCFQHLSYMGSDRAHRRYFINQSVGGLYVEVSEESAGTCLDKPTLPANMEEDTLAYVTKLFENEKGGSDKENDSNANSIVKVENSPKKPINLNGLSHKLNGLDANVQLLNELNMCTGDVASCNVHGGVRPVWIVYHTEEQIDGLIQALNKRGMRESELKQALETDKDNLIEHVNKCPLYCLNPDSGQSPPHTSTRLKKFQPSLVIPEESSISDALELSLIDCILELEEKIFHGCLGSLKVTDREAWRGTLMLRGYDKQTDVLNWGPARGFRDDCHLPNGEYKGPTDPSIQICSTKYRDPGWYLPDVKSNGVKDEENEEASPSSQLVRNLASALLQVEQGVHHKYIKRPLGLDDKERKERDSKGKSLDLDSLERWEISLMESNSLSQVILHLFTLDSSITWSASILNASCRICRRKTDPDNMLLCDQCNKGHHLYCLKPKLTKVPEGDWFCDQCKPKEVKTPRKKRKLFSDEDIEEELNDDSTIVEISVCGVCGSGGELLSSCISCLNKFHIECVGNKRRYVCQKCTKGTRESDESDDNTSLVTLKTKFIRQKTVNGTTLKYRKSRNSKDASPAVNGMANGHSKSKKSKEESHSFKKSKSANNSLTNGYEEKSKKRSNRSEVLLHTNELEDLLRDVMRHKDCWPFYEPVSLDEVPDYFEVITTPMDFSTIKDKLSSGKYKKDQQLIDDATQVFINCFTYNQDTHPVAKSGVRLEKYFNKRCQELDLPTMPDINLEETDSKKRPLEDDEDMPKAKKAKRQTR